MVSRSSVLRMLSMPLSGNLSIEPTMLIRRILHSQNSTIRLVQGILTLHDIPISGFLLRLNIPSVVILNTILELVLGVILKHSPNQKNKQNKTQLYTHGSLCSHGCPPGGFRQLHNF